jgi:hypothetical protein
MNVFSMKAFRMLAMKLRTANSAGVAVWAQTLRGLPQSIRITARKRRKPFALRAIKPKLVLQM